MIDTSAFEKFLKKKGKKPHTVEKMIREVTKFSHFLQNTQKKEINDSNSKDLDSYAVTMKNVKPSMYCLMNFFQFAGNETLRKRASFIREQQTKKTRKVFPLKDFLGINPEHAKILDRLGIKNVNQMLEAGKTKKSRENLAKKTDIPIDAILELVELSDITRIGYVKSKLSRLYYNSGIRSPQDIVQYDANSLRKHFQAYIEESGWDGMVPNLTDLKNNITHAKKVKKIVEK
ncbi:MAG: DUF4332 domain-containing protein [Promethearchaeota archaeon]